MPQPQCIKLPEELADEGLSQRRLCPTIAQQPDSSWVPSLSAVGLSCPLLVQMLHSHVDFHSEGWPWPILCQLEPIAHTASFTFSLCSSMEWQTPRPLGSPPPRWFGFKVQCVWLANRKRRIFFFFKSLATLNLLSIPICGHFGSLSLQSVASHWQTFFCWLNGLLSRRTFFLKMFSSAPVPSACTFWAINSTVFFTIINDLFHHCLLLYAHMQKRINTVVL